MNYNRNKWRKKPITFSLFLLITFIFIFTSYKQTPKSIFTNSPKTPTLQFPQCTNIQTLTLNQKFLWFSPHSGFSNQLSELKNAILIAAILNRSLIVPPVLDHHAVALGSCPKFRVLGPNELRRKVWDHAIELLQSDRYVSMADIVDLSSLVSASMVKFIDFRVFASLMCGLESDLVCFGLPIDSRSSSILGKLRQCGSLISGFDGNVDKCLYALDEDCRTTVWTYQQNIEVDTLDAFQPDEQLQKKKRIFYVRRRRDVHKALGPGSKAELATVVAFGSVFTTPYKGSELYIDIHKAPRDKRIQTLLQKIDFLPFVLEIMTAGKKFASEKIMAPFLCAQLRLLDGQFKNHWKVTFTGLKQKLELLQKEGPLPIHVFVMTDLPKANWSGSYLGELESDSRSFKLFNLHERDPLVVRTAEAVVTKKGCPPKTAPDILLYIEETICSCATLGFVGTVGSTIAESIELMRKSGTCSN